MRKVLIASAGLLILITLSYALFYYQSNKTLVNDSPLTDVLPSPLASLLRSPSPQSAVLVGAGDIASCDNDNDEATATLLDSIEGTVFTTGDNVYPTGSLQNYTNCYEPTWGRHKARTRPAQGNHDIVTSAASGSYQYFGANAGMSGEGYYSYDLGEWHIIVLNSNCPSLVGCGKGSKQEQWLKQDLAQHATRCTLAYWHHPRYSSGKEHGNNVSTQAFWEALYEAGADVIVTGHEHHYERFAPLNALGQHDEEKGVRQFVVGTGGRSLYGFGTPLPTSEIQDNSSYGVLKLTLEPNQYSWEFIGIPGATFTDSGTTHCH